LGRLVAELLWLWLAAADIDCARAGGSLVMANWVLVAVVRRSGGFALDE